MSGRSEALRSMECRDRCLNGFQYLVCKVWGGREIVPADVAWVGEA
jgi:hypothetical protein